MTKTDLTDRMQTVFGRYHANGRADGDEAIKSLILEVVEAVTPEELSSPQTKDYLLVPGFNIETLKSDEYLGRVNNINGFNDAISEIKSKASELLG